MAHGEREAVLMETVVHPPCPVVTARTAVVTQANSWRGEPDVSPGTQAELRGPKAVAISSGFEEMPGASG